MWYLYKKELNAFFSNITGYVVIIVFLIINSLFLWVFKGDLNITESGYATLDSLFIIAPWVFLFLVPAVTMKLFAEEKSSGTLDLLLTRPLSELQIIFSKYLAGVTLVIVALLPTFIYYVSIYQLSNPVGNIDHGGIIGSLIGLFFLAAIYIAIGLFTSALTANQIVAFILAVVLCFFFYIGFDYLGAFIKPLESAIVNLGINEHYRSMSIGVIDSRDVIYFLSVIALFIFACRLVLQSRKW
jgi:ABC-2 type transport system permease protein